MICDNSSTHKHDRVLRWLDRHPRFHMHFTPISIGDYEIACAELCGLGHYKMHGMLKVVSQEEFDKWLAAREAEKQ